MTVAISQLLLPTYRCLPGPLPMGKVISYQTMRSYYEALDGITAAEEQVENMRRQAEEILITARDEAENILNEARSLAVAEAEEKLANERLALHQEMQTQVQQQVLQAVQWMVETACIEKTVVQRLEEKIRTYLLSIFESLLTEEVRAQFVVKQIMTCLPDVIHRGSLVLQINPVIQTAVDKALAGEARVCVTHNLALEPTQAILDNGLLQIKINFDEYCEQLRTLLSESCALVTQESDAEDVSVQLEDELI